MVLQLKIHVSWMCSESHVYSQCVCERERQTGRISLPCVFMFIFKIISKMEILLRPLRAGLENWIVNERFSKPVIMCAQSLESCPTLFNPMDCSPPGSLYSWDSPGRNSRVGCCSLAQGVFSTQGSNLCLLHCKWFFTAKPPGKPCYQYTFCL